MEQENNINELKQKAATNALRIENATADYIERDIKSLQNIDIITDAIREQLLAKVPDMDVAELNSTYRTLNQTKNSTASTIFSQLNSDSQGTTLLDKHRDRETNSSELYEKVFHSAVQNKVDLTALTTFSDLLKQISKDNGDNNNE